MKILLLLAVGGVMWGQMNLAAIGVSYTPSSSPTSAVTGLYAKQVSSTSNTWAFTVVDALPTSTKPLEFQGNTAVGVAQKLFSVGKVDIYTPVAAGFSWNGSNTGWNWSGGGLGVIPIKGTFRIMPSLRWLKSSVSNGSGYQVIGGVLFGWGF